MKKRLTPANNSNKQDQSSSKGTLLHEESNNEELETSKQELLNMNKELVLVNVELQDRLEELSQANIDMENLLTSSGIATLFLDRQMNIKGFTPAVATIFNLIRSDIGQPVRNFDSKIDWSSFTQDVETVLSGQFFEEREVVTLDGKRCYMKRIFPYRTKESRIDGIVVTFIDITDRKQFEKKLQKAHDELELRVQERTEELAVTVDNLRGEIKERERMEAGLLRLNRLYAVLSETNQAIVRARDRDSLFSDFCRIAVEHGGFLLSWVGLLDLESGQVRVAAASGATAYLEDLRITINEEPEGKGPTSISIREGTYCICNDFQNDPCTRTWHEKGCIHGICGMAAIALKEGGRVIGALTLYSGEKDFFDHQHVSLLRQMGTDVSFALDNLMRETRRKEAEQALREETLERLRTVEELREKERMFMQQSRLAALGEMINNIAHQWRQPLNVLGLLVQEIQLCYEMGSFNKDYLDDSVNKSMGLISHMSQTIDDFRNFFKPDKEKVEFTIHEVVARTVSLVEDGFRDHQIGIDLHASANPSIIGFPNEFAQVLLNILMNARDAVMERHPDDARVTITISKEKERAVVTIADNAGGIAEEILGKIFEPYFTTKGPDKGTGIGLFMSKSIIEKNMNGRLTARNIGSGTEFRIEMPVNNLSSPSV